MVWGTHVCPCRISNTELQSGPDWELGQQPFTRTYPSGIVTVKHMKLGCLDFACRDQNHGETSTCEKLAILHGSWPQKSE